MTRKHVMISVLVAVLLAPAMYSGPLSRVVGGRALSRLLGRFSSAASRSESSVVARILARDRARDAKVAVSALERPRVVQRYTTLEEVKEYLRRGIRSGTHFTAKASPGRPLSAERAASRYGLPKAPEARLKIELPPGTKIKSGKVVGGHSAGYGEVKTYRSPLPPGAVRSVAPVPTSSSGHR
jgi:hypothetical protein